MTSFDQLGLSNTILKALSELGFEQPSEIQAKAIPQLLLEERDFIGLAQTGTGKTAAYALPLLEKIDTQSRHIQGLILSPTRELGQQIATEIERFSKFSDRISQLAVYGGTDIRKQMKALEKPKHIIIATPGRLIDLIKRKAIRLDQLRYLILDEADEMLNMGFREDIDRILTHTPDSKKTWLFSATMPKEIRSIVNTYMDQPFEVRINAKEEVNINIEHRYSRVRPADRTEALSRFLDLEPEMRGVVFCRTKRDTQQVAEKLLKMKYRADALHGDLSQAQRDRVMKRFRANELQVLVATDVAARGIDVEDLTHVIHYDLPDDMSYYTHRSGRTARAGKEGISIAFIKGNEQHQINRLENKLGIAFNHHTVPSAEEVSGARLEDWCMKVLQTPYKKQVTPELLEQVVSIFGNLSKEDIIGKLLAMELDKQNAGDQSKDLNETARSSSYGSQRNRHERPRHQQRHQGPKSQHRRHDRTKRVKKRRG